MPRAFSPEHRRKLSESHKGKHLPLEQRLKIAAAGMGRVPTEETRRKISESNKGHGVSEETRKKMSESAKGHKNALGHRLSPEVRQRLSETSTGNQNALGYHHSEEVRLFLSKLSTGHTPSEETRKKLSTAHKGSRHSAAAIQKMSDAKMGHPVSKDTRKKLSVAGKRQWSGIPKWKRDLFCASWVLAGLRSQQTFGLTPSSLERIMHKHFADAGVEFETQKAFFPYFVDIWIPSLNLVVEVDGVYWHNLPGIPERDRKRDRYLIKKYNVRIVRVPEASVRSNPQLVVDTVLNRKTRHESH